MRTKRIVNIKVLPGEPLDGTGQVCIHLFVRDNNGPFTEPHVLNVNESKQLVSGPARGRLACDPNRTVKSVTHGGITTVTMRTDDARAVTCPKCKMSRDYAEMMELVK